MVHSQQRLGKVNLNATKGAHKVTFIDSENFDSNGGPRAGKQSKFMKRKDLGLATVYQFQTSPSAKPKSPTVQLFVSRCITEQKLFKSIFKRLSKVNTLKSFLKKRLILPRVTVDKSLT